MDLRPLAPPDLATLRRAQIRHAEAAIGRRLQARELPLVRICRMTGAVMIAGVTRTIPVLQPCRPRSAAPPRAVRVRIPDGLRAGHGAPRSANAPPGESEEDGPGDPDPEHAEPERLPGNLRTAHSLAAMADRLEAEGEALDRAGNPSAAAQAYGDAQAARRTARLLSGGVDGVRRHFGGDAA